MEDKNFSHPRKSRWPTLLLVLGAAVSCAVAHGRDSILTYQGPDRDQRVLDGAKQEGTLTVYTSINATDIQRLKAVFEEKYGIKVNVWRASSEKIHQKTLAESKAAKSMVDVIETNGTELESMHREKVLQKFYSPHKKDLIPEAVPAHAMYLPTRLNLFAQAYNRNQVRPEDVPKTYQDLLNPKWKGRLGIEITDADWMASVIGAMGEQEGIAYFRKLAGQDLSKRKGHALLSQLVVAGEVPFALTVYSYVIQQAKKQGAPVEWMFLTPAIARPNAVAIYRNPPHPHAALLFADFMLGEAQPILVELDHVPTNMKVESKLKRPKTEIIDPVRITDEWDKWSRLWNEIIDAAK